MIQICGSLEYTAPCIGLWWFSVFGQRVLLECCIRFSTEYMSVLPVIFISQCIAVNLVAPELHCTALLMTSH